MITLSLAFITISDLFGSQHPTLGGIGQPTYAVASVLMRENCAYLPMVCPSRFRGRLSSQDIS